MSPITLRPGARALGALLVSAALVAVPSVALADPTPEPSVTATGTATTTATPEASATPSPTVTPTTTATPEPTATATATPAAEPSATSSTSPTPTSTASPSAAPRRLAAKAAAALAVPGPTEPETQAAADFIARTLDEYGEHYVYPDASGDLNPTTGYPDHGNTIDGFLALAGTGTHLDQAQQSLTWLGSTIGTYLGKDYGDTYVGPTAKSLIGVTAMGGDPTDVGGIDLLATLEGLETSSGRFSDTGSGDYSITLTQALAIIALSRAGAPVTTRSVDLLLDQQCSDGGFRSAIGGSTCVSDPDATAFAVQALLAVDDTLLCWADVDGTRSAAATAAADALDELADLQAGDGSIESADGVGNANTTGVAAQAFAAGGRTAEAAAAAQFIATLQYDGSAPAALRGGIAFSDADRTTGTEPTDSDLRATPQATLALAGLSLLDVAAPGVEPPAPVTECPPEPAPTSSSPGTTSAPATTTPAAGADDPSDPATPVAAAATGALAQTGSNPLGPVLVGLLLLGLGVVAVVASRRRGAHA